MLLNLRASGSYALRFKEGPVIAPLWHYLDLQSTLNDGPVSLNYPYSWLMVHCCGHVGGPGRPQKQFPRIVAVQLYFHSGTVSGPSGMEEVVRDSRFSGRPRGSTKSW